MSSPENDRIVGLALDDAPRSADDPAAIQREIEETRSQMTTTLNAIEQKLSPRQITNEVFDTVRDAVLGTGDGSNDMLQMIRNNPIPGALVGLGLGWMIFSNRGRAIASDVYGASARWLPQGRQGTNGSGNGLLHRAAVAASDVGERARETTAQVSEKARALAGTATRPTARLAEDNPLLVGAVGVILGATIAVVLPMTRRENEVLGDAQAELVERAEDIGREVVDRARTVAETAGRAAVDVVERELGTPSRGTRANGKPNPLN